MKQNTQSHYRAYLLRLWREEEEPSWRASLEDPRTGELFHFASLDRAFAFIQDQTEGGKALDQRQTF